MNSKIEFGLILKKLEEYNVKEIEILYSGCGDEGSITDIELDGDRDKNLKNNISDWDNIFKFLEDIAYKLLEDKDDWVNNDGGQGNIIINVSSKEYIINHGVNYMQTKEETFEGNCLTELIDD